MACCSESGSQLGCCRISLHARQLHVVLGGFAPKATAWLAFSLHRDIVIQAGVYGMSSQVVIVWFYITPLVLAAVLPTYSRGKPPGLKIGMKVNPY